MRLINCCSVLYHTNRESLAFNRLIRSHNKISISGCVFHGITVIAVNRGSDRAGDSRLIDRCIEVVRVAGAGTDYGLHTVHNAYKLI